MRESLDDYIGRIRKIEPDARKAGKRIGRKGYLFDINGNGTRLCLFAIHSRLGGRYWFVSDASQCDPVTGLAMIIAQGEDAREVYRHALKRAHLAA